MYLVTGATGSLGRRIVRSLRHANQPVRAFVRLTSRYSEIENLGAEIFIGDLDRERDIKKACQGVQYIISAHGSRNAISAIEYRANIELIDCAKEFGVQQFVFISVLGADRGYEDAPTFKAKREVEKYLQSSGVNYTILRPSGFYTDLLPFAERLRETGIYLLIGDRKNRVSVISTDDLAAIAVKSINNDRAINKIFPVGGPEILKREDIPVIFGKIFNREPVIINPPIVAFDGLRSFAGLLNPKLGKGLGTLRALLGNEFFCTADEINTLESVFQINLETLEAFIRRYLSI